jgi:hypothetical protein
MRRCPEILKSDRKRFSAPGVGPKRHHPCVNAAARQRKRECTHKNRGSTSALSPPSSSLSFSLSLLTTQSLPHTSRPIIVASNSSSTHRQPAIDRSSSLRGLPSLPRSRSRQHRAVCIAVGRAQVSRQTRPFIGPRPPAFFFHASRATLAHPGLMTKTANLHQPKQTHLNCTSTHHLG